MKHTPKVSICIPFHWMRNWQMFLTRCLTSIEQQSFTDYEIVLMKVGTMPVTSNRVIESAKGELIKILYMDDFFAHPDALKNIVENFSGNWLVTACNHYEEDVFRMVDGEMSSTHSTHYPKYSSNIIQGVNTIGSPSVLTIKRETAMLFDEKMSWLLDCDLYARYYEAFGEPTVLNDVNVTIGIGQHQMTNTLTNAEKQAEHDYLLNKYSTYISA